jgi:hypothetical protein
VTTCMLNKALYSARMLLYTQTDKESRTSLSVCPSGAVTETR